MRTSNPDQRLLRVDRLSAEVTRLNAVIEDVRVGDVWVVNTAATFPASLRGVTDSGASVELRLLPKREMTRLHWTGVLFGNGSWKDTTESRPAPPRVQVGEEIRFAPHFRATITSVVEASPRLITFDFAGENAVAEKLWTTLYQVGKPVQYSHAREELKLWSVQTPYAAQPWASEMPSAGWPLQLSLIEKLRSRGARVHGLAHATGLSATGDPDLDAHLPLPEFYALPEITVREVLHAKESGARVIAVGTSVFRALEGNWQEWGTLKAGPGETALIADQTTRRQVVDGILTGVHAPGETHFSLLECFLPRDQLLKAMDLARAAGLRNHEFGDSCLILASA